MDREVRDRYIDLFISNYKSEISNRFPGVQFRFPLSRNYNVNVIDFNQGQCAVFLFARRENGMNHIQERAATLKNLETAVQRPRDLIADISSKLAVRVDAYFILEAPLENKETFVQKEAKGFVEMHYGDLQSIDEGQRQYFVAHEFSVAQIDDLRKAIEDALGESGLTGYYADDELRQGHIFKDKILPKIRSCRFGIYEISNAGRPNVFLELGAGLALGKPCIIICKTGTEVPADLGGLDRIEYQSLLHLTSQLKDKLKPYL